MLRFLDVADAWFDSALGGTGESRLFVAFEAGQGPKPDERHKISICGAAFELVFIAPVKGRAVFEVTPLAPQNLSPPEQDLLWLLLGPSQGVVKVGS